MVRTFRIILLPLIVSFSSASGINLGDLYGSGLSPGAEIYYATDANYSQEVQPRYYDFEPPTFYGAIKPATEADIAHIVNVSAANGMPFLATGGGHGNSLTMSKLQEGLVIDLGNFNAFSLDTEKDLLTVGGSTIYLDVLQALYDAGKQLPMPNNPCPGVVGAALGGGVGLFQGLYGLALDALVSVELVTGRGEILTASDTENSDLFWGLRGAGYNYGIVTSATFRVYDAPNDGSIVSADFMFPGSVNGTIWETLASFDNSIPDKLVLNILASYDSATAAPIIIVNAVYLGSEAEAQPYFDIFADLGPVSSAVQVVPWTEIASVAFFGANAPGDCTTHGVYANDYTIGLARTDVPTFVSFFNDLTAFWQAHPDYSGFLVAERMSTAFLESIPDGSTGYGHRDIKTHILFENIYANASLDNTVNDFMQKARATFQATSGFAELQAFVNYAHGDEGPEAWYTSAKLSKLKALKSEYDPLQLLSWNNPVPLI